MENQSYIQIEQNEYYRINAPPPTYNTPCRCDIQYSNNCINCIRIGLQAECSESSCIFKLSCVNKRFQL